MVLRIRLLTLLFTYGSRADVATAFVTGFNSINIDTWLTVIPQIIARIDTPIQSVRSLVHEALSKLGTCSLVATIIVLKLARSSYVRIVLRVQAAFIRKR